MRHMWTGLLVGALAVTGLAGCTESSPSPGPAGSFEIRGVTDAVNLAQMPAGAKCGVVPLPASESGWICDDATDMAYLAQPAVLVASDVKSVEVGKLQASGSEAWEVRWTFTDAGAEAFHLLTEVASQNESPADQLLMVVDGAVVSAPHVRAPIVGNSIGTVGDFSEDEARALAAAIAGPSN